MSKNVGNALSIAITGDTHSGKTNLAVFLMRALKAYGFEEVSLICDNTAESVAGRLTEADYVERVKQEYPQVLKAPITIYEGPVFVSPEIAARIQPRSAAITDPEVVGLGSKVTIGADGTIVGKNAGPVNPTSDRDYVNIWATDPATFTEDDWKNAHVLIGSGVSFPMPVLEHTLGMTVTLVGRVNSVSELPSQDQQLGEGWLYEEEPLKYVIYAWTGAQWERAPLTGWMNQEFSRRRDAKQMILGMDVGVPDGDKPVSWGDIKSVPQLFPPGTDKTLYGNFEGTVIPAEGEPIEITLKGQR